MGSKICRHVCPSFNSSKRCTCLVLSTSQVPSPRTRASTVGPAESGLVAEPGAQGLCLPFTFHVGIAPSLSWAKGLTVARPWSPCQRDGTGFLPPGLGSWLRGDPAKPKSHFVSRQHDSLTPSVRV